MNEHSAQLSCKFILMPANCRLKHEPHHMRAAMRAGLEEPFSWFDNNQEATQWKRGYRFVNIPKNSLTEHAEYNKARQTQIKVIHDWALNKFFDLVKSVDIDDKTINCGAIWVNRTQVIVLSLNNRRILVILKNLINPISRKAVANAYETLTEAEKRLKPKYPQDKFFRILISPTPERGGQRLIFSYTQKCNFIHWNDLPYTAPKSVNNYAKEQSGIDYGHAYIANEDWGDGIKEIYARRLLNLFRIRKPKDIIEKLKRTHDASERETIVREHYGKMGLKSISEVPMKKREVSVKDEKLLYEDEDRTSEEGLLQEGGRHIHIEKPEIASYKPLPIDTIYKYRLLSKQNQKIEYTPSHKKRTKYRRLAVKYREKVILGPNQHVWVTYKVVWKESEGFRVVYGPYFRANVKVSGKWKDVLVGKSVWEVAKSMYVSEKEALKMCIEALRGYLKKDRAPLAMKQAEAHLRLYEEQLLNFIERALIIDS